MEALAGVLATPIVKTIVQSLIDILRDETLSILNVHEELKGMERNMMLIMNIIKYLENRSLYDKDIRIQINDLKDIAYDIEDVIDDYKLKAQDLASTSSSKSFSRFKRSKFSRKIAKRVKKINDKLEMYERWEQLNSIIPNSEDRQQSNNGKSLSMKTTRLGPDDVVGSAEEDAMQLMNQMLCKSCERPCVNLAILGMAGIGKTTLAQKIFHIVSESRKFQQQMWICVSKDYEEIELLKEIIRKAKGDYKKCETKDELTVALERTVRGKRFFLVLDDVWKADIWDDVLKRPLESGANESKILITTREDNVAKGMSASNVHHVKKLIIEEGWKLLHNNVFETTNDRNTIEDFKENGFKIVLKCGQLPLAIKTIAGVLKTKPRTRSEWEDIISDEVWTKYIFEENNKIMNALYLSYEHLPYQLKQCFVCCSFFPEDHIFDKNEIARMWIAQGFLGDKATLKSGEDHYRELVNRNLLETVTHKQPDDFHKMHDLLRSLGQSLGRGEYFCGNENNLDKNVRHLFLQNENSIADDFPQRLDKGLRTLMLIQNSELKGVPKNVFQKLHYLRVLSLSGTGMHVVPNCIKSLLHLRYLDLSYTEITSISESIGYLKNLQFLHLIRCKSLVELPECITMLQNLMSLEYTDCPFQMPEGIGRLKQLQSLVFKVAPDENTAKRGCTIKELQSLNSLLHLYIIDLPKNLSLEEARSVELVEKNHLQTLYLGWKFVEDLEVEDISRVTEAFEELRPPPTLSELRIFTFYGLKLPNWMSYLKGSSLNDLVRLEFDNCHFFKQLPGFGSLPQLSYLKISSASSIEKIGPEFLGRGDRISSTYFPKLMEMKLDDLSNLEEWQWDGVEDDGEGEITPFPCLQRLYIMECPKLKRLPDGLQHVTSLVRLHLSGIKDLKRISGHPTVKDFHIQDFSSILYAGNFNSLEFIYLIDAELNVIPLWLRSLLAGKSKALPPLQRITIQTGDSRLFGRLCPWDNGSDWLLIKDIPHVQAFHFGVKDLKDKDAVEVYDHYSFQYIKSPFCITFKRSNTSPIIVKSPHELKHMDSKGRSVVPEGQASSST